MSTDAGKKKPFQDPALFLNPVRMPWGETLEGPPCLPQDHGSGPQIVYDEKRTEGGSAIPLSTAQQTELSTLLHIVKTAGASTLSETQRKRLQWLLSRPEQTTTDATMILTKKGRVTFT